MNKLTIEEALEIAKNRYEPRFKHIYSTYKKATYLAQKYHLDVYKCQMAAILHDYAKYEPTDQLIEIIKNKLNPDILNYDPVIYHGEVGAYLVSKDLGINDVDILNAIKYHVTGHPEMNDIAKVIFIADYIEDLRMQPGVEFCRYLSDVSLDLGVLGCAKNTYFYLLHSKKNNIHPLTKLTYEKFLEKVGIDYDIIRNRYESM